MRLTEYDYIYPTKDTFAGFTLETRFPKILNDVLNNSALTTASKQQLSTLRDNLDNQKVEPLNLPSIESIFWTTFFEKYTGKRYQEVPFFFLEIYFYRLINQIIASNQDFADPFGEIKKQDLVNNTSFFRQITSDLSKLSIEECIHLAVEGNQADLSQLAGSSKGNPLTYLIDDTEKLRDLMPETGVNLIADNAGVELFSDLVLIKKLADTCQHITLHLKHLPLLVSDATPIDLDILLTHLDQIGLSDFVLEIRQLQNQNKLTISSHPFWNAPTFYDTLNFMEAPQSLLISKGDANYRRFFHDKQFAPHLSFDLLAVAFEQVFALRTLKSDIQTGLTKDQIEYLQKMDPHWMHNGKHAVIQRLK